jgi:hypothetical protein
MDFGFLLTHRTDDMLKINMSVERPFEVISDNYQAVEIMSYSSGNRNRKYIIYKLINLLFIFRLRVNIVT